jgi:hypothetical protein
MRRFTMDFNAISLALEQSYTRIEAARNLGINANMLGRWISEQLADDGQALRGNKVKYLFVDQHKKSWPVDLMCRLLGVTRGGYSVHQRRDGGRADRYHQELLEADERSGHAA